MRVLLVAYFYPPAENIAARRWQRFISRFVRAGIDVRVWTGPWDSGGRPVSEGVTCLADPISSDARTGAPGTLAAATGGAVGSRWIPKWLLIDGKFFWSWKVFWRLVRLPAPELQDTQVIVTGPPWSALPAVALGCAMRRIPLVVDFRDLWSGSKFLPFQSRGAIRYFEKIEAWVIRRARKIMTVSAPIERRLIELAGAGTPIHLAQNGFEGEIDWTREDFNRVQGRDAVIHYSGTVVDYHGVRAFLDAWQSAGAKPRLRFRGRDICGDLRGQDPEKVEQLPLVGPDRAEAELSQAAVLLQTLDLQSTEAISGKLMGYLRSGRPTLFFGPTESPAACLIQELGMGWVVDARDPKSLAPVLETIDRALRTGEPFEFAPKLEALRGYGVDRIAGRLLEFLDLRGSSDD